VAVHDVATLRRYYRRGTLLTAAMLLLVGIALIIVAKPLLLIWLKTDRPGTRAVLPLLLLHTVIGGSTAPARAILFAAGKARVFAISAVAAGVINVIISLALLLYTDLALVGVIIGTVTAVFFRCAIFIPWYTMRTLNNLPAPAAEPPLDQSTIAEPL
jgi:Na+-driven multidrug efflux pump